MCSAAYSTLTLDGLLSDPLILDMMRSDGVSERDHEALLFRVRKMLTVRDHSGHQAQVLLNA